MFREILEFDFKAFHPISFAEFIPFRLAKGGINTTKLTKKAVERIIIQTQIFRCGK